MTAGWVGNDDFYFVFQIYFLRSEISEGSLYSIYSPEETPARGEFCQKHAQYYKYKLPFTTTPPLSEQDVYQGRAIISNIKDFTN